MKVTKKDIEVALSLYNIGKLKSFKIPNQGLLNRIVFIETTKGKFVLKIALVNVSSISYVLGLLCYIKMRTAPRPIFTIKKELYIPYGNYRAFIYRMIEGDVPKYVSKKMLRELGTFLSIYHLRSSNFKFLSNREEILGLSCTSVNTAIKHAGILNAKKYRETVSYINDVIWKYSLPDKLPRGPIHVDVKPDNSLFCGEKLKGVIDFDNSYNGPLILDLGVMMSWYGVSKGEVDMNKIRELYRSYSKKRKLTNLEKNCVFDAFHFAILRNSLRGLEFLAKKKLSKKWVNDYIDYYLKAERQFVMDRASFLNFLSK